MPTKRLIYIIDSSAILSGKPIQINSDQMITSPGVSEEFSPGGRDYRTYKLLREKGLAIRIPSSESLAKIDTASKKTGDFNRLSPTDKEILALALDINSDATTEAIIFTDDYSIQNLAQYLHIQYLSLVQKGIQKTITWDYICSGCYKKFNQPYKLCPICGAAIKQRAHKK
jgi:UPF0271 protein